MRRLLSESWWALVLHGVAAIAFGVLAFVWPGVTLLFLLALFAVYVLLSGAAMLYGALRHRGERGWWMVAAYGVASIAAGAIAIFFPAITAVALVVLMGISAIFTDIIDIVLAIRLRKEIEGEWLLAVAGGLSILFGVLVLSFWEAGALALVWLIALHATFLGVLLVALGLRLRSHQGVGKHGSHRATA